MTYCDISRPPFAVVHNAVRMRRWRRIHRSESDWQSARGRCI